MCQFQGLQLSVLLYGFFYPLLQLCQLALSLFYNALWRLIGDVTLYILVVCWQMTAGLLFRSSCVKKKPPQNQWKCIRMASSLQSYCWAAAWPATHQGTAPTEGQRVPKALQEHLPICTQQSDCNLTGHTTAHASHISLCYGDRSTPAIVMLLPKEAIVSSRCYRVLLQENWEQKSRICCLFT